MVTQRGLNHARVAYGYKRPEHKSEAILFGLMRWFPRRSLRRGGRRTGGTRILTCGQD